jgi:hypothetical protein
MQTKKPKASILVVTMMIMGIILISALSISLVSIQERKASLGSNKSSQAYQIADTGIENVMNAIITTRANSIKTGADIGSCSDGKITGAGYVVELKIADGTGNAITADCTTDKLSDIIAIKSVGTASGQAQRSIEAAVASGTLNWYDVTVPLPWSSNAGNKVRCAMDGNTNLVYLSGRVSNGANPTGASTQIFTLPIAKCTPPNVDRVMTAITPGGTSIAIKVESVTGKVYFTGGPAGNIDLGMLVWSTN